MPVRLAHLSDFHLALPVAVGQWNLKRAFGRLNWLLMRRRRHDPRRLETAVADLLQDPPDAVIVTGDLGQMGLPQEILRAQDVLMKIAEKKIPVFLVNGNHDLYGQDAEAEAAWNGAREVLRLGAIVDEAGVARVGDLEILLTDQAVACPLFQSWGRVGEARLAALGERLIAPPPADGRIAAGHYPLRSPRGFALPRFAGLRDAEAFAEVLAAGRVSAYLCGHIHCAYSLTLPSGVRQHCAGSATGRGRILRYACEAGTVETVGA